MDSLSKLTDEASQFPARGIQRSKTQFQSPNQNEKGNQAHDDSESEAHNTNPTNHQFSGEQEEEEEGNLTDVFGSAEDSCIIC